MPNNDYILRSDALKAILGMSIYDTIEELEGARTIAENTWADGLWDAYKIIEEEVDAADVAEVKHGKWIQTKDGDFACSLCGYIVKGEPMNYPPDGQMMLRTKGHRYCGDCGAKMEWGGDDA